MIRKRAKQLSGRNDIRFSKKEVRSLIKYVPFIIKEGEYIKVPYKADYIFRAIFSLVDEIAERHKTYGDLEIYVGKIRRDCFYDIQSSLYKKWYDDGNQNDLTKALLDDLFAGDATISKKF